MQAVANVVLAIEVPEVAEEVMHFLDRTGSVRVLATAADERQLAEAVRQLDPSAVVAAPSLLRGFSASSDVAVLAVDTGESTGGLRAAIGAGARGFFVWPAERAELADAVSHSVRPPPPAATGRAKVVTVSGARGGSGATFVTTHLAAAFARTDMDCVLVDMDALFGDVSSALGVREDDDSIRTIGSLDPVAEEISAGHLEDTLWKHASGFRVLFAPRSFDAPELGRVDRYRPVLEAVTANSDLVVLHTPRGFGSLSRMALEWADTALVVLSLDVMSFHGARRLLQAIEQGTRDERIGFVVNRAARAEIVPADVSRVFGRAPVAIIPEERTVSSLQDRGRLLPANGRVGRMFSRLATQILDQEAAA